MIGNKKLQYTLNQISMGSPLWNTIKMVDMELALNSSHLKGIWKGTVLNDNEEESKMISNERNSCSI